MSSRPTDLAAGAPMEIGLGSPRISISGQRDIAIETLRVTATFLLVSYHVLNGPEMKAIAGGAHPLRLANEFLLDLRMPLFAFIAGYVYAIRPIGTGRLASFVGGKARRLLVPGLVAALSFALVASFMGRRFAVPFDELWRILVFPYVHFWFLQAVFLILVVVAAAEKIFGTRAIPALFAVSSAALLAGYWLPFHLFSAQGAAYLMPYFTMGALFLRHRARIERHRAAAFAIALLLLLGAAAWNASLYAATGAFSETRHDLQSWAFAVGACLLLMLFPIRLRLLAALGTFSFTIYLYHVFGTAGAREAMTAAGIRNVWLLYLGGVLAGFGVPIALHLVAQRFGPTRRLVLGLR